MPEKLTLKNRVILETLGGLTALDGAPSKNGIDRYDFDEHVAWNLAKLRRIFEDARRTYDLALRTLATTHRVVEGQSVTEDNVERVAKFIEAREALGEIEQELSGIVLISRQRLQKAGVKIPGVLAALMPVLSDP
jgi:hypothetical protein